MSREPRIGWVLDTSPKRTFPLPWDTLSSVAQIRYAGIAKHLARNTPWVHERYLPWRRYDVVIFLKIMSEPAYRLALKLKKRGTKIVFDANVNYYETTGDFIVPGTKPTPSQQQQAKQMTELADTVVADSSYLAERCAQINAHTTFIPDAVDTTFFKPVTRTVSTHGPLTLIWSGIGKKAHHLELIEPILFSMKEVLKLVLVVSPPKSYDPPAPVLDRLRRQCGALIHYWNLESYRGHLQSADLIISPKDLHSSYEMAHTEYKITLGMSMGLAALASPQRSYIEAIGDGIGGTICHSADEWKQALQRFIADRTLLSRVGDQARQRVVDRYAIPIVAERYMNVLKTLV